MINTTYTLCLGTLNTCNVLALRYHCDAFMIHADIPLRPQLISHPQSSMSTPLNEKSDQEESRIYLLGRPNNDTKASSSVPNFISAVDFRIKEATLACSVRSLQRQTPFSGDDGLKNVPTTQPAHSMTCLTRMGSEKGWVDIHVSRALHAMKRESGAL